MGFGAQRDLGTGLSLRPPPCSFELNVFCLFARVPTEGEKKPGVGHVIEVPKYPELGLGGAPTEGIRELSTRVRLQIRVHPGQPNLGYMWSDSQPTYQVAWFCWLVEHALLCWLVE